MPYAACVLCAVEEVESMLCEECHVACLLLRDPDPRVHIVEAQRCEFPVIRLGTMWVCTRACDAVNMGGETLMLQDASPSRHNCRGSGFAQWAVGTLGVSQLGCVSVAAETRPHRNGPERLHRRCRTAAGRRPPAWRLGCQCLSRGLWRVAAGWRLMRSTSRRRFCHRCCALSDSSGVAGISNV